MKIGQQLQSGGKGIIKNQGGRPTKYKKTFVQEVYDYLEELKKLPRQLPKIEDIAIRLNVNVDTVNEWRKLDKRFSVAIEAVKDRQAQKLLDDGIYGKTNSTIVKLVLMSNHNYKERSDQTSDNKVLPTPLLQNLVQVNNEQVKELKTDKNEDISPIE